MRPIRTVARFALVLLAIGAAGLGGCTKEIILYQYPPFYNPNEIRKIGIFPFRCPAAPRTQGGVVVADALSAALAGSGTYKHVYNRNDIASLAEAHDARDLFSDKPSDAARALKKFTDVDAIIVGSVTTYSATSRTERRTRTNPVMMGKTVVYQKQTYNFTRNEANVAAIASLIRTSDGQTLHTTSIPAKGNAWAQGSPPKWDQYTCLDKATRYSVDVLTQHFAVVRKKIKVETDKALRTASELYDDKWTWQDRFKATDKQVYAVVQLPWQADRNRFRIVIVRKDMREELASRDIVWSKKHGRFGYGFNPGIIANAGGGPGVYTIKFYSGPEPVLTRDFHIVE